mmetsp:Transcript_7001/g.14686  ORF Transcript_7001/g.14686 Transcript_7001/m.14686 type:complete len:649 (-) Transcript_7001:293-2239(-)
MITESTRKAKPPRVHVGPKGPALTIEQKRQFVLDWFESGDSIRDFCAGDEQVPRGFIRKAVNSLGLRQLRKSKDEEGVAEAVADKVSSFRPGSTTAEGNPPKGPKLTIQQKRQFALEWFASGESVRDFRAGDEQVPRWFIRKAANDLRLRQLQKTKDEEGVKEDVAARVNSFFPVNAKEGKAGNESATVVLVPGLETLLKEWFEDPDLKPIPRFLRAKGALGKKDAFLRLVKKASLRKLRKEREEPDAREVALGKIASVCAISGDRTKQGRGSQVVPVAEFGKCVPKTKRSLDEKKGYVIDWFVSGESVGDFRAGDKQVPRAFIRKTAKALDLRKLQKGDDPVAAREIASLRVKEYRPGKDRNVCSIVVDNPAQLKSVIVQWFEDPQMRPIPRFLKDNGVTEEREAAVELVRKTSLRKLRRDREDPKKYGKALAIIDRAFFPKVAKPVKIIERELEHLVIDSWKDVARPGIAQSEQEGKKTNPNQRHAKDVKALLIEWFEHEEKPSINQFLAEKGAMEVKAMFVLLVKKHGLRRLQKNRNNPEAREQAMKEIDSILIEGENLAVAPVKLKTKLVRDGDKEKLKALLIEFFFDDETSTVADFLQKKGDPDLHKVMTRLVRKLNLNKLKKQRIALRQKVSMDVEDLFAGK